MAKEVAKKDKMCRDKWRDKRRTFDGEKVHSYTEGKNYGGYPEK